MSDLIPWLGLCHIRQIDDNASGAIPTLVAVWADSIEGFEREVHFHTNTHGLQMIGTEEVLPAPDWLAKHPNRKDGQRLAGKVSAKHPVALAGFGAGETSAGGPPDDTEGYLHIEEIEGVEPLDMQFGVHPPKTVPDALYEPLFGQPDPTPAEVAQYGSAEKVPPLHTYAILDAAKVVNFVEMLEASGLEHRCLFKGEAAQEMRDVAPYVVRLEEGVDFTRNLFSHDPEQEVPWFMWDREPGIYIRSRGSLDDMWKHFRKFTKVQDEDGKHSYFRSWETRILIAYAEQGRQTPEYTKALENVFGGKPVLFHSRYHGSFFQISMPEPKEVRAFPLSFALRNDIRRLYFYSNMFEQAEDFYDRHPDECARYGKTARVLWKPLFEAVDEIYAVGLKDPQLRARFLMLSILKYPDVWPAFCKEPGWQALRGNPAAADTRFRDICAIMKHYSDRGRGTLKTWW